MEKVLQYRLGISKSNAGTCIIDHPTVAAHINVEIEHNTQTSQADFISVIEMT